MHPIQVPLSMTLITWEITGVLLCGRSTCWWTDCHVGIVGYQQEGLYRLSSAGSPKLSLDVPIDSDILHLSHVTFYCLCAASERTLLLMSRAEDGTMCPPPWQQTPTAVRTTSTVVLFSLHILLIHLCASHLFCWSSLCGSLMDPEISLSLSPACVLHMIRVHLNSKKEIHSFFQ